MIRPQPSERHCESGRRDSRAYVTSGEPHPKGYVGRGMITPIKKIPELELLDWQKIFNTAINRTRAVVERVIANLKNWRILHTDYRRPLDSFATTISAAIGLLFYSLA